MCSCSVKEEDRNLCGGGRTPLNITVGSGELYMDSLDWTNFARISHVVGP